MNNNPKTVELLLGEAGRSVPVPSREEFKKLLARSEAVASRKTLPMLSPFVAFITRKKGLAVGALAVLLLLGSAAAAVPVMRQRAGPHVGDTVDALVRDVLSEADHDNDLVGQEAGIDTDDGFDSVVQSITS